MRYEDKDILLMFVLSGLLLLLALFIVHSIIVIVAIIKDGLDKLKQIKMKNTNNEWVIETDDFSTIKRLAHEGNLLSLKLIFSLSQFNFIYKAIAK